MSAQQAPFLGRQFTRLSRRLCQLKRHYISVSPIAGKGKRHAARRLVHQSMRDADDLALARNRRPLRRRACAGPAEVAPCAHRARSTVLFESTVRRRPAGRLRAGHFGRRAVPQDHLPGRQPGAAGAGRRTSTSTRTRTSPRARAARLSTTRACARKARQHPAGRRGAELLPFSSYSARKLGMRTTGHAGGSQNLTHDQPAHAQGRRRSTRCWPSWAAGLFVTELMGQGVNYVTGDYSRGAAGFWVEGGKHRAPGARGHHRRQPEARCSSASQAIGADVYVSGQQVGGFGTAVPGLKLAGCLTRRSRGQAACTIERENPPEWRRNFRLLELPCVGSLLSARDFHSIPQENIHGTSFLRSRCRALPACWQPVSAPAIVHAQANIRWRLASSFPKALDTHLRRRRSVRQAKVGQMSGGKFQISTWPRGR